MTSRANPTRIIPAKALNDPLAKDFRNFLWRTWQTIGLPQPTPLQYDFATYLQEGSRTVAQIAEAAARGDVGARKILMAFRGASKSYVTTDFAVWRLYRDRSERILVTSATAKFAGAIATFAYSMVRGFDWLSDMKPRTDQRQSALAFDVAGAPAAKDESFASESIFGQITGRRASTIIGDDLETPNTSDTEGARTELRKRMGEFGAIILPGGDIILLGTAQTEQTVYRDYAEEKGYELRIYPIVYPLVSDDPKQDERAKYGPRLAPMLANALAENPLLAGTSTEPSRFTELDILSRRKEWGQTEFDRQFKMFLDSGLGKGNPIKMRDLVALDIPVPQPTTPSILLPSVIEFNPLPANKLDIQVDALTGDSAVYAPSKADVWVPAEEIICYVDPSGEGEDETTWTIVAGLLGRVFLLHQGASQDGHSVEVMKAIARDCKLWRVGTVKVESNFGQGMFGELLAPAFQDIQWQAAIEGNRQGSVQKEKRIVQTLEPITTDHRLVVRADVIRNDFAVEYADVEAAKRRYYRLTYQLSRMTTQKGCVKHDDRADGLAGAVAHFVGVLLRQLAKAAEDGRVKAIEREAERIIELRKAQGLPLYGLDKPTPQLGRPLSRLGSIFGRKRK